VRHGEVQLSLIPEFNLGLDIDHSLTGSSNNADIIGGVGHSIKYDAAFSGLNRLVWNSEGLDLQVDALSKSFISRGENQLAAWKNSETAAEVFGDQPGAVRLHRQGSDESGEEPGFSQKVTPATIFRADEVLTCTEDEETGLPLCTKVDFCADGSLFCDEPSSASRGEGNARKKRSDLHLHRHKQNHAHHGHVRKAIALTSPVSEIPPSHGPTDPFNSLDTTGRRSPARRGTLEEREPLASASGGAEQKTARCRNPGSKATLGITFWFPDFPSVGQWTVDDDRYDNAYNVRTIGSCTDGAIGKHVIPEQATRGVDPDYCTEHIVEKQTLSLFLRSVTNDTMPGTGLARGYGLRPIYCDFMYAVFDSTKSKNFLPADVQKSAAGSDSRSPVARIAEAQGSVDNWGVFVLLEEQINGFKQNLWRYQAMRSEVKASKENTNEGTSSEARKNIRTVSCLSLLLCKT
jgi:hypothetical protein